jgi:hypothetical protein
MTPEPPCAADPDSEPGPRAPFDITGLTPTRATGGARFVALFVARL